MRSKRCEAVVNNVEAMLALYVRANPTLTRREAFDKMCKNEAHFLGLDLTDEEVRKLTKQENVRRGVFYKKRKRRR